MDVGEGDATPPFAVNYPVSFGWGPGIHSNVSLFWGPGYVIELLWLGGVGGQLQDQRSTWEAAQRKLVALEFLWQRSPFDTAKGLFSIKTASHSLRVLSMKSTLFFFRWVSCRDGCAWPLHRTRKRTPCILNIVSVFISCCSPHRYMGV